MLLLEVFS